MKQAVIQAIESEYNIKCNSINHVRTMIGRVYKVTTFDCEFLIKWYRPHHREMALSSLQVQRFLANTTNLVPKVYLTQSGEPYTILEGGILVLMEWIEGREVTSEDRHLVLKTYQDIHNAMTRYPNHLPRGTSEYYYKRYIELMKDSRYDIDKISEIERIAQQLFDIVRTLPKGYCHSDFHTGNMIVRQQQVIVFDFDASHMCTPYIDLITYLDETNFNSFRLEDLIATRQALRQHLSPEISTQDVLAFLPLRHMEIIPNIINAQETKLVTPAFLEEQYHWIRSFYNAWKK